MNGREIKGYSILAKGDMPIIVNEETFLIPSQSSDKKYKVTFRKEWSCECPDFRYRKAKCKHIHAVEFWLKLRTSLNSESTFEMENKILNGTKCIFCNSSNIVKNGSRITKTGEKQRYKCKECKKRFVLDPIKGLKGNGKIVTLVLDLYFKGISLRKIQDHLKQFYKLKLHHETIRRWIMKFTKIMNDYVNKIQPKLSGKWQADEQMIKTKGKWLWSWNILDEDTRFLIANQVTEDRAIEDARKVFAKAKKIADKKPEKITTDGLWSYEKAIKKELLSKRIPTTKHERLAGISKKTNNNMIERFHGSFRERDKVMRGFKEDYTAQALINGFRTYYNFIRPHQALNGLTPSEVANINLDLNGGNRWFQLINRAINNDYSGLSLTTPMLLVGKKRKNPKKVRKDKGIPRGPYIRTTPKIKRIYKLRIFSEEGKEVHPEGLKTEFRIKERAEEFIEFYKWFYPSFEFKIEEKIIK